MKKTLLCISLPFLSLFAHAQEFIPLQVTTGYNADVVANGVGTALSSTTNGVDNVNYSFIAANFQATGSIPVVASALPVSGIIPSTATAGMQFQLASYTGNNSLRLATANASGTLAFGNQIPARRIFLLVTSGSGVATITGTINFSDNTSQPISSTTVPDWFDSTTLPRAITGIGRVNRMTDVVETPSGNPRIYQLEIAILPANQTKLITGITVTKTSGGEDVMNLMGVSAEIFPTCPSPTNLTAQSSPAGATVSWTAPATVPASGYDYFYSTGEVPTATTTPTATVPSTQTSVVLDGLNVGQLYYFWVRSNCSTTDKGIWRPTTFTTGQITATFTTGDILTDKTTSAAINVSTSTTCPGVLTVAVPAGYRVASVATSYSMQTALDGFMSEQRSLLVCNTTGLKEAAITSGVGGSGGTYDYSRSGSTIANGATGNVEFELRAWRTYGTTGCNASYNKVLDDTWKVTVTYQPLLSVENPDRSNFKAYPNPVTDILNISGETVISEIVVYNYLGQKVIQQLANNQSAVLNTSSLAAGNYLVIAKDIEGNQKTLKIVKK